MFRKTQIHLDMIDTTSRMALKMSCLRATDNNVERARELYDFLIADIAEIPDVEPVKPGVFEQVRQGATDVIGWLSSHKDDVSQGVAFLQSLRKSSPPIEANLPPIPKI